MPLFFIRLIDQLVNILIESEWLIVCFALYSC